jgi:leader peptidase (prepilin peptidase)/N-methyltransferase
LPPFSAQAASYLFAFGVPTLLAVLGACWGSFAATLSERWPQGRSVVQPRSHCESCQRTLSAWDLIPVLSYILARGQCRNCGASISLRYSLIEIASASVGLLSGLLLPAPDSFWVAALGWQLLLLAILDAEHFWLPNRLVGLLAASGLGVAALGGPEHLLTALIGSAAGFTALFAIAYLYKHSRGRTGMGGGDPKLLGAIGAWVGWQALPMILLIGAGLGIGLAIFEVIRDGRVIKGGSMWQRRLPLGTCLAISTWVWLLLDRMNLTVISAISTMSLN